MRAFIVSMFRAWECGYKKTFFLNFIGILLAN